MGRLTQWLTCSVDPGESGVKSVVVALRGPYRRYKYGLVCRFAGCAGSLKQIVPTQVDNPVCSKCVHSCRLLLGALLVIL